MAYSQQAIEDVLRYLDDGHSTRDAQRTFGISKSSISLWKRKRDGAGRRPSPHPVKYPFEVVRLALGLAYGGHGLHLGEVACMLDISAPTISSWKKRYITEGGMEIPEIDPREAGRIPDEVLEKMTESEKDDYIHQLELKAAILEGTVKILKAEGIEEPSDDGKAALVDALPKRFTVAEALRAMSLSSGSYYCSKAKSA